MMKLAIVTFLATFAIAAVSTAEPETPVYELRTYHANPGKLEALHARFRDHTVKLFVKHGMTNVGYWVPKENDGNVLIYLMQYSSREAREQSWKGFLADPDWKAAYAKSTEDGKLVAKVDSIFLKATDYSPALKIAAQNPDRLFELRQYTTNEGKLPNINARFRDHTIALFNDHGMTNVIYLNLLPEQDGADNTLVYLLAHKDEEARNASFDAFRKDPKWQAAQKASEKDGKILIKGGVKSTLLVPTDYSPLK
jgi:uncharacterized protein YbaA (DUF1428 family)